MRLPWRRGEQPSGPTPGGHVRFPGYDVLGQAPTWDAVTAGVVLARLVPRPACTFFTESEEAAARALADRFLAQDREPKVPVVEVIDERLAHKDFDGWRYEDMPPDDEAWRASLSALDDEARSRSGKPFAELPGDEQDGILADVQDAQTWHGMDASHVWNLWSRYILPAFYSHPWAWNEIGFGGPAYPRGYKNRGVGILEPWEKPEAHPRDPVPWGQWIESVKRERPRR